MDSWAKAPVRMMLDGTTVDIWKVVLEASAVERECMSAILSADEIARAGRFHFERDRHRYISCRGALRKILARYLSIEATDLSFSYSEHGKPFLGDTKSTDGITFNLSHSSATGVIAVSRNRRVGIDIEFPRQGIEMAALARRYFSQWEAARLESLRGEDLTAAFFSVWTRKEAYVKARGDGLSLPLGQFDVSIDPDEASLLRTRHDPDDCNRWIMKSIPVNPGSFCTLVAESPLGRVRNWHFRFPAA